MAPTSRHSKLRGTVGTCLILVSPCMSSFSNTAATACCFRTIGFVSALHFCHCLPVSQVGKLLQAEPLDMVSFGHLSTAQSVAFVSI